MEINGTFKIVKNVFKLFAKQLEVKLFEEVFRGVVFIVLKAKE